MTITAEPVAIDLDREPPDHDEDLRSRSVLGRVSIIIDAFDATSPVLSLNELTDRAGLPKSTVHRFAEQLVALGWLERSSAGYRVGMRLFEVGGLAEQRNRLRDRALPFMQDLAVQTRCAVHLALLDGVEAVYLDKLPSRGFDLPTRQGGRMPAYCTAVGKAMLAFAPADQVERVLGEGLRPRTPYTIVVPDIFRSELAHIATTGVALDREEAYTGVACAAAAIRGAGRAIGAVSVTGPTSRFDAERFGAAVKQAATGIWAEMFSRREGDPARFRGLAC